MIGIASYRRKQKFVQPLTLMREFYYDYRNESSTINRQRQLRNVDPCAKLTLSVDKFERCLKDIQNNQIFGAQTRDFKVNSQSQIKKRIDSVIKHDKSAYQKDAACFRSTFSNIVPFLKHHPAIDSLRAQSKTQQVKKLVNHEKNLSEQSADDLRVHCKTQQGNNESLLNYPLSQQRCLRIRIRNPTKQYVEMCEQKQKLDQNSYLKKNRLRKTRNHHLLTQMYKDINNEQIKQERAFRVRPKLRLRQDLLHTKQNIFPS